jgi:peptidyl-tRNA hydrolase, PTH2 family
MRRGKEVAQGAHASMMWLCDRIKKYFASPPHFSKDETEWLNGTFTKVCLQVDSEEALLDIFNKAKAKGLLSYLVTDSGKTEFGGVPTNTCCAVGPNKSEEIDEITGELKLY